MYSNERFLRGKSRLIEREQKMDDDKKLNKKLGRTIPEDTIGTPVIGEWSLNPDVKLARPQLVNHLRAQTALKQNTVIYPSVAQTPVTYQPHERERERSQLKSSYSRKITIPVKIQTPNPEVRPKVGPEPKIEFPEGTTTTDLNQILRSKHISPSRPLPPLQDPDSITDPKFLPLEFFDDVEYQEFSIEELMKDPRAFSKYTEFGQTKWNPCKVLNYDEENRLFTIEWDGRKGQKKVARFNIRFLREDAEKFEQRVAAARHACTVYEATIRFDARVKLMPKDKLPELPQNMEEGILKRVPDQDKESARLMLNNEVKDAYKEMNNKLELIYEIDHNPLIPNREEFMLLVKKEEEVPDSAIITRIPTFQEALDYIKENLLFGHEMLSKGLFSIWQLIEGSLSTNFILSDFSKTLLLEDFITQQYTHLSVKTVEIKTSIEKKLVSLYNEQINIKNNSKLQKIPTKDINRFIGITENMIHTMLYNISHISLKNYLEMFINYRDDGPEPDPLFYIDLYFSGTDKLEFLPAIDTFDDQLISLLSQFETTVKELPMFDLPGKTMMSVPVKDCLTKIAEQKEYLSTVLSKLFKRIEDFINSFRYLEKYLKLDPDEYAYDFDPNHTRTLDEYRTHLEEFKEVIETLKADMKPYYNIGLFKVMSGSFKNMTINHLTRIIQAFLRQLNKHATDVLKELNEEFNSIQSGLNATPMTPEQLANMRSYVTSVVNSKEERATKIARVKTEFEFLEDYRFEITDNNFHFIYKVLNLPILTNQRIAESEKMINEVRIKMIKELKANQRQLENDALTISEALTNFIGKYTDLELTSEAAEHINYIATQLKTLQEKQVTYNKHERLFEFEQTSCRILLKLVDEFTPLHALWNLALEWTTNYAQWMDSPFPTIRADQISTSVQVASKKIVKIKKELSSQRTLLERVVQPLSQQIEVFKNKIPLIVKLRNQGIKRKHWDRISEIVGFKINPTMEMSLSQFINQDLHKFEAKISEITNVATQEYNIETLLDKMDSILRSMQFTTIQFKNSGHFILQQIDEITSVIDDQLVTTQSLMTSPYIQPMKEVAHERILFLRSSRTTIEEWIKCQKSWLYIQPIFAGTSITSKLKEEASLWTSANKTWSKIMTLTRNHPNFFGIMQREEIPDQLVDCNRKLNVIVHGIYKFLEQKRISFPRFFFLSNDELVYLISHSTEFSKIQESMPKIFEYVSKMTVTPELTVTDISDPSGEKLNFLFPVDTSSHEIEDWFISMEDEIHQTLKEKMKESVISFSKKKPEQWIFDSPAQVTLIINQVIFTQHITMVLKSRRAKTLQSTQQKITEHFDVFNELIKQPLTPQQVQLLSSLMMSEVHNRDICETLKANEVYDVDDFEWRKQMRYYIEDDQIIVRSFNNEFTYTFEYAGNSPRIVITPLTDRCYQTILAAMKLYLGGSALGTAGTGKTETIRALAKALGRACIVYNCSDEVGSEIMSQFLAGVASSGAWACFDEFNRINIEVLSVIQQQIKTIQDALASQVETFVLDGRKLTANRNCGICITQNPGYAGRTELPDNVKVLFRPIVMTKADVQKVSEIILFSGGFTRASELSKQITMLFKLCKTMLSTTKHYDWGLRKVKSVLMASFKLLTNETKPEEEPAIIVTTIKSTIIPALKSFDVPIFNNIIEDVFPGVTDNYTIPAGIKANIQKAFTDMNLAVTDNYVNKAYELLQTTQTRHGIMLIGGTMGGKTSSWKALKMALEADNVKLDVSVMNPKAITTLQMYGMFNPATSEWKDGIMSHLIRDRWFSSSDNMNWIICDGPVDSMWIESMNSLLDDNKILCLPNNERIQLNSKTKLIFETDNLKQASPATVSRCGMVFYDPSNLSWKTVIDGWCARNKEYPDITSFIKQLAESYMPFFIQFFKNDIKTVVPITPNLAINNFLSLIDCFMPLLSKPQKTDDDDEEAVGNNGSIDAQIYYSRFTLSTNDRVPFIEQDKREIVFERIFLFCITWAFGSFLDDEQRALFDHFIRSLSENNSTKCAFPPRNSVFDYFADLTKYTWMPWTDSITDINFTEGETIDDQVIPNNEIASTFFITRLLLANGKHAIIHGPESAKSLIMKTLQTKFFDKKPYLTANMQCTSITKPQQVINFISQYMHKHQGVFAPLPGEKLLLFFDNLSSIEPDNFGSRATLELIRQLVTCGGWYNTNTLEFDQIQGYTLIATSGVKGGGSYEIDPRTFRHFFFLHQPEYKSSTILQIVNTLFNNATHKFINQVHSMIKSVAAMTCEVIENCSQTLLPVPSKLHYTFSLRTICHIIKGILLINPSSIKTDTDFIRLYYHELHREILDRLNTVEDRRWFKKQLIDLCPKYFHIQWSAVNPDNFLMFNNFSDGSQIYKDVKQKPDQICLLTSQLLEEHNSSSIKKINITVFKEAVYHISALSRVTSMNRGHALLIGLKSSWRRSLARLTLHIENIEEFTINITKNYSVEDWREDLKNLIKKCGIHDESVGFIISDSQIVHKQQLEDLQYLMATGYIPHLYERDEFEGVKAEIAATEMNVNCTIDELLRQRICTNLHIFFAVSPSSPIYKEIMMSFTSIRSEAVIDWFIPWSDFSLKTIAQESLGSGSIGSPDVVDSIVVTCVALHKYVEEMTINFYKETGLNASVTPSLYFYLLKIFHKKLKIKQRENAEKARDYENGVEKIKNTGKLISQMSEQLDRDIPELKKTRENLAVLVEDLKRNKGEVEEARVKVQEQGKAAEQKAVAAKKAMKIAQEQLEAAAPILKESQEAVQKLDKDSLVSIKKLHAPTSGTRDTFEAVCIMFNRNPRKIENPITGMHEEDYWPETISMLNDVQFVKNVTNFKIEKMTKEQIQKLKKYVPKEKGQRLDRLRAANAAFQAVGALYEWVCASFDYWHVYQEVLPKKIAAESSEKMLKESQEQLEESQKHLEEIEKKLNDLQTRLTATQEEEKKLASSVQQTQVHLARAEKLLTGLSGESKRWEEAAQKLRNSAKYILGDTILISAILVYLGIFSPAYRQTMIEKWKELLTEQGIKYSENFSIVEALGNDIEIRSWIIKGLSNDTHSIENALIITKNEMSIPLLIDPQGTGTLWLRENIKDNLMLLRFDQPDFLQSLRAAVSKGYQVIIENIGSTIDPTISPILNREIATIDDKKQIIIGGDLVSYNPQFRLYLTTQDPNPHFSPEICASCLLINFKATPDGLKDLLSNIMIEVEKSDLDKKRIQLMESNTENIKKLEEIEARVLNIVSNSATNDILKDDVAIDTLNISKKTSVSISLQLSASETTEQQISLFRKRYMPVVERAAILYFSAADLNQVNPMYQFSLRWFADLFRTAISNSTHPSDPLQQIQQFIKSVQSTVFTNISYSLFAKHKLLYAALVAIRVQESDKKITQEEINALVNLKPQDEKSPIKWISDELWGYLISLSSVSLTFKKVIDHIKANNFAWQKFIEMPSPTSDQIPYKEDLTNFQKLVIFKTLRLDKANEMLAEYAKDVLGPEFTNTPIFNIANIFEYSKSESPFIIISAPGDDPTEELTNIAYEQGLTKYIKWYSLGKGRGADAEELIRVSAEQGYIVILQNCHLSLSWMPKVEYIVSSLDKKKIHRRFRLFLITTTAPEFPIGLLFMSQKLVYEAAKDIKDNMLRLFMGFNETEYSTSTDQITEKQLLFHLAFFHSVVIKRLQYGSLGWNNQYSFNFSDFSISKKQLRSLLSEMKTDQIPFKELVYILSQLNYGGRVTDKWDKRTLQAIAKHFFNPKITASSFSLGDGILVPSYQFSLKQTLLNIQSWSEKTEGPTVLLSKNSETVVARRNALTLFSYINELQKIETNNKQRIGESKLQIVLDLQTQIPPVFNQAVVRKKVEFEDIIVGSVILHEVHYFKKLIETINASLLVLKNGLNGSILIDQEHEAVLKSIVLNKVPEMWLELSYPSVLNLTDYIKDLRNRVFFVDNWLRNGPPIIFKIGVFFHPEELLTAFLQKYAREKNAKFSSLHWLTTPLDITESKSLTDPPSEGIYVDGLMLEGARWDYAKEALTDCGISDDLNPLPVIHLKPFEGPLPYKPETFYECPVFRTQERGNRNIDCTNYIFSLFLSSKIKPDKWIEGNVAAFTTSE